MEHILADYGDSDDGEGGQPSSSSPSSSLASTAAVSSGAASAAIISTGGEETPGPSSSLPPPPTSKRLGIVAAPPVREVALTSLPFRPNDGSEMLYNLPYDAIYAPVAGPSRPGSNRLSGGSSAPNTHAGHVTAITVGNVSFESEYHNFMARGFAVDPSGNGSKLVVNAGATVDLSDTGRLLKNNKRYRAPVGDPSDPTSYVGPWADTVAYSARSTRSAEKSAADGEEEEEEMTAARMAYLEARKRQKREAGGGAVDVREDSIYHGKELYDYQGKSFVSAPSGSKMPPAECFPPKKLLHTWTGHNKGVSCIEFFPEFGHLLLSGSNDFSVKIWDVHNNRAVKRTYNGHGLGVKCINFLHDGSRFLSGSFDKYVKLWDTETGQVISRFTMDRIPNVVKFHPVPDHSHSFLVGQADSKIIQWDTRAPEKFTQEYTEHLGPVNTITFVDDNKRFVSTSDDKSLRFWDWGIPVVIKYICEPSMFSMPAVALHPTGAYIATQSQDNQILVYTSRDRFSENRKKKFTGHMNAGYPIQLGFSPDGKYIMSGDTDGGMWFWNWRSQRVERKLKCHSQPTIGCVWNPLETSRVATCSWDGTIKYWD